jgi:hypothetical protein
MAILLEFLCTWEHLVKGLLRPLFYPQGSRKEIAMNTSNPSTLSLSIRGFMTVCLFHLALVSCTPVSPTPPPPQNNGPAFVINSPSEGSLVSGATFFSVQPFNASEVQSVSFTAGGTDLIVDAPGEDTFKVFLIPREFPDGELTLNAVVTGKDGTQSQKSIKVNVVGNPPSSATVTADGALLGTQEESGAISTLSIPGGAAEGASVNFEARSKADVKAETGVDYDALGVTFLGAQEISSSQALNTPVGVSSGGFGPMVQPNQAVVNYTIAPDGDGDGIGELMVINTASVAPNGDVISDPVPQIQLGAAIATDASGTQTLRSLQTGTLSGPPGTFIEIEATGFNQFSAFGNVALFKSSVDGTEIELPALVNSHFEDANPVSTIGAYIPLLPAGAATMTLKNVSTNEAIAPIAITVETAPALTKDPAVIIDEMLAEAITVLSKTPELQGSVSKLETVRTQFAELGSNPTPDEAQVLNDIAVFISNSNMGDLLNQIEGAGSSNLSAQACSLQNIAIATGITGYGAALMTMGIILALAATGPFGVPVLGVAFLTAGGGGLLLGGGFARLLGEIAGCLIPPPPEFCLPPYKNTDLAPFLPRGIRAQQVTPPSPITGMGSVIPPGGDSCGSAVGGNPGASLKTSSRVQNQVVGTTSFFGDLAGRFVIKVFLGGSSLPFTGISDSSGYFYIPLIPAGQPFEAIAIDTLTKETRSFEGIGPEIGQSTYMFFDFLNEGESGAKVISYDTNTQGVHDGVDIYFFEGKAGDVINLAVFSEEARVDRISYKISDPNGFQMQSGLAGGLYFETGLLPALELELDGLYTFTLDGSQTSGNYTLGLSKIKPPTPIDVTAPIVAELTTLGDRQFYSFTGSVNDAFTMTLSHDSSSSLNTELLLREPLATVPFYKQPVRLRRETTDTRRISSGGVLTLNVEGDYVLEVGHDNPFDEVLQNYLGTYQVDVSVTP